MPLMTSLTSVCAPKPMATPTTPAPAISGPISTPSADSAIRTRHDEQHDEDDVAQDRQQGAQPGAGVVGVAIGFGPLTVVKDIISGTVVRDDAFAISKYVQSGSYKGTFKSFSLRSVKLRPQRGPLFSHCQFGELGAMPEHEPQLGN